MANDQTEPVPSGDNVPERLFEQLYTELHNVARRYLGKERPDHTLQPTDLINEAFLRLAATNPIVYNNRVHFLRMAARKMRHILVDHAKRKKAQRRGGAFRRVSLSDNAKAITPEYDIIDLDRVLNKLAKRNERQAAVIEMRFIAALTVEEVAEELGVSPRTIKDDTRFALAWLRRELE